MNSPKKITIRTSGHNVSISLQGIDSLECLVGDLSLMTKKIVFTTPKDAYLFAKKNKYVADITCPLVEFICSEPRYAYYYSEYFLSKTGKMLSMIPGSLLRSPKYAAKFSINVYCGVIPDFDKMIMNSKYMPDYFVRCHLGHYGGYKVTKISKPQD